MSDTPHLADECNKHLDNGWEIRLFKNQLGSYTAEAFPHKPGIQNIVDTDDFEPSRLRPTELLRLSGTNA